MLGFLGPLAQPAQAQGATALDFAIPNGHFYTQANGHSGAGGTGYAITDAGGVAFWSEFRRLGGVEAVGYPASERFEWDGFTVQVFQRVVFQWRPESQSVAFVNVFDDLARADKNDWLYAARSTPRPLPAEVRPRATRGSGGPPRREPRTASCRLRPRGARARRARS
jgi:hypothetical protein